MVAESTGIPFLGGNQRVRDHVLLILSTDFPLTTKQVYAKVTKQGLDVSYQAVHKVVIQLIADKIIEKEKNSLQLSKNWISQVKDYAMSIDAVYTKGKNYALPKKIEGIINLHFDDISTFIVWAAETFRDMKLTDGKKVSCYGLFDHLLWPMRFNFMDFELLRQMVAANPESMAVCAKNTPFDQWIGKHYRLGGMKRVRIGTPKLKIEGATMAHGDYIIQISYSPETIKFMNKIYNKINNLGDLFQYYFSDVVNQNTAVDVKIERNPLMARMLKNQVLDYLNEEKNDSKH